MRCPTSDKLTKESVSYINFVKFVFEQFAHCFSYQNESVNVSLIMESDHGVFNPWGLHFTGDIIISICDNVATSCRKLKLIKPDYCVD